MYTETSMFARAFQTDPYSICNTSPLGVRSTTFETSLNTNNTKLLTEWSREVEKMEMDLHCFLRFA